MQMLNKYAFIFIHRISENDQISIKLRRFKKDQKSSKSQFFMNQLKFSITVHFIAQYIPYQGL